MKDPAFLFYPEAFIIGTRKMTDEEVGQYIRALCEQFFEGELDEDYWLNLKPKVAEKFSKNNGKVFNKRLKEEMEKRRKSAEASRKNGAKGGRPRKIEETQEEPKKNLQVSDRLTQKEPIKNLSINTNTNINTNKDIDKNSISESSIRDPEAQAKLDAMRAKIQEANK